MIDMLITEDLNKYYLELKGAVDGLFQKAQANQTHNGDLLLCVIGAKRNKNTNHINLGDFEDEYAYGAVDVANSNLLTQKEMVLYLKLWESNYFKRLLYNLCDKLLHQQSYDFEKDIENSGAKSFYSDSVIKPLSNKLPKVKSLLESIYVRQIRNAIAHSQYYFLNNYIQLTNKDMADGQILGGMSLVDWQLLFHRTVAFFKAFNDAIEERQKRYVDFCKKYGSVEVIVPTENMKCLLVWNVQANSWLPQQGNVRARD